MSNISAALVKELREKTGAGMMDCKKALNETDGDIEAAVDWLRKKGLSAAEKKSGRVAAEGLVGVYVDGQKGAVVEVNAETDFVSRNDEFQRYVRAVGENALTNNADQNAMMNASFPHSDRNFQDELTNLIATIGENMNFRRADMLSVNQGVVCSYIHSALTDGLGRIGVLIALESNGDSDKLHALGKQLSMHIAAAQPQFLSIKDVDDASLARERDVLSEQARASGKPENIIEKMVEGRIRKYYEEVVLEEQIYVIDNENKISKVIANAAKEMGCDITITGFVRYALGEGIEKKETDFAAEVAEAIG